jgi:predicted TIM-barrel fold metal-dependent hydrolase
MKIYISYANEDVSVAKELGNALEQYGFEAKIVDHTAFNYEGDVAVDMLESIKNCDCMLCLYSYNTNDSNFVSIELNAAVKREKRVYIIKEGDVKIDAKNRFVTANSIILKSTDARSAAKELEELVSKHRSKGDNNG